MLFLIITIALLLIGCQSATEKAMEDQIEQETGKEADVDLNKEKVTIETDEGKVEIEGSTANSDEWCQTGSEWKMTATGENAGNAQWLIEGLMKEGEFKGLCHVIYTADNADGTKAKMDYYFSEDGETGYFEMDVNGQKIKSEWKK